MSSFLTRHVLLMGVGAAELRPFVSLFVTPLRQQIRKGCCNSNNGTRIPNARLSSTSPSSVPNPSPSAGGNEGPAKLTLFQRFKQMYKDYYYVLIPVHIVTSAGWFGGFYHASQSGVDIGKYMKKLGLGEHLVNKVTESGLGHLTVAYALYKIATPARYAVTLGGTTWAIQRLQRMGLIKPAKEIISKGKERFLPPKGKN